MPHRDPEDPKIPVVFLGRVVGYMPAAVFPDIRFVRYAIPTQMRIAWGKPVEMPDIVPDIVSVEFEVRDRRSDGRPGELHVTSLKNLRRLLLFQPEDWALPRLTAER